MVNQLAILLRPYLGVTIAKATGVRPQTVVEWKASRALPHASHCKGIAKILGCSIESVAEVIACDRAAKRARDAKAKVTMTSSL